MTVTLLFNPWTLTSDFLQQQQQHLAQAALQQQHESIIMRAIRTIGPAMTPI
jgi:hypothetical protein